MKLIPHPVSEQRVGGGVYAVGLEDKFTLFSVLEILLSPLGPGL